MQINDDQIEINYSMCEFLKRIYMIFGKDFESWLGQSTIMNFMDYKNSLRSDIQQVIKDEEYLQNWLIVKGYIEHSSVNNSYKKIFTDKFVREVING